MLRMYLSSLSVDGLTAYSRSAEDHIRLYPLRQPHGQFPVYLSDVADNRASARMIDARAKLPNRGPMSAKEALPWRVGER